MKITRLEFICIVMMIWCGFQVFNKAHAAPVQYYGTPIFYSKFIKDEFLCTYNPDALYGYCGDRSLPEEAIVGFTLKDNPEKGEGVSLRLYREVVCIQGICETNYGERMGSVAEMGVTYWEVPQGFYMDVVAGKTRAFRHGTGPSGSKYQIKDVKVLPMYQDPPKGKVQSYKDTTPRYDVYCNPAKECSYLGRPLLATDLPKYVPKVLTTNCGELFCYNPDQTIAGLNPKFK